MLSFYLLEKQDQRNIHWPAIGMCYLISMWFSVFIKIMGLSEQIIPTFSLILKLTPSISHNYQSIAITIWGAYLSLRERWDIRC